MPQILNPKKSATRSSALAGRRTRLVKTDGLLRESQLGRAILAELLAAVAKVLSAHRGRTMQVRSADPAEASRSAAARSAEFRSGVEATWVPEGGEDSFIQPVAHPIMLEGGDAEGGLVTTGDRSRHNQNALGGVHLYNLRRTSCRWPLGPLLAHTDRFCGAPCAPGCPYCPEHRERAFSRPGKRAQSRGTHESLVETRSNHVAPT